MTFAPPLFTFPLYFGHFLRYSFDQSAIVETSALFLGSLPAEECGGTAMVWELRNERGKGEGPYEKGRVGEGGC